MKNTIQQCKPQIERIEIDATLTDQKTKKEYKYQQTCFIESVTMHIYEENLVKTNYNELLKEQQNRIEDLFNEYLESEEGKSSEYSHITNRTERIMKDEKYSLITKVIQKQYEQKLSEIHQRCKVEIKDVYPDFQMEKGAILFRIKDNERLLSENKIKEIVSSEVKEWSQELISSNHITAYQIKTKIVLPNKKVNESSHLGSFHYSY